MLNWWVDESNDGEQNIADQRKEERVSSNMVWMRALLVGATALSRHQINRMVKQIACTSMLYAP